jgi:hypothetical protein
VSPVLSRREAAAEPTLRTQAVVASLAATGSLHNAIQIPSTVRPFQITTDLRVGKTTCSIDIDAPQGGPPATGVKWLLRQLTAAPDIVRIEARARGAGIVELLRAVSDDPSRLIADPKKDIRLLRLGLATPIGTKRGRGRGSYIDSMLGAVDGLYSDVVQHLKAGVRDALTTA